MPKLTSLFLLTFPLSFCTGVAIAVAENAVNQPSQRPSVEQTPVKLQLSQTVDTCGKYCENYPPGLTKVRMRDWQP
ncbi:hypothetical protein C1752_10573 [Acaryochloris thomasi RCC1774]|uniref:Uncharacterized protein n=1 Tax=Acaryochloris thomasi RCC1774 TaxID=1764569 RepID=A0A2W1J8W9_9CYAN|nr:hypothetical protein [Acaryochloris thomasi]PZD70566.1 hypothetical protein C1752_10573 [Acaryochloris thomasi RCC1774]